MQTTARLGVLLAVLLAAATATVRVPLGGAHYAHGERITTTTGRDLEHFAGVPYATRAAPFEAPAAVSYAAAPQTDDDQDDESMAQFGVSRALRLDGVPVNTPDKLFAAPNQGTLALDGALNFQLGGPHTTEDETRCLQLEVFRPAAPATSAPMRVLVYIHGGMMESDSRASVVYRVDDLLRGELYGDTIVVSLEYSLGAYGWWFDETADRAAHPPNLVLHEVIEALRWVQSNIAAFGGDPNNVTLGGHSAGAAIAHWMHLVMTPRVLAAKGFAALPFHQLLLMSGTALLFPAATPEETLAQQASVVAKTTCAGTTHAKDTIPCLQRLAPADLRTASLASHAIWRPTIDGDLVPADTQTLIRGTDNVRNMWSRSVRVLMTTTPEETSLFIASHADHVSVRREQTYVDFGLTQETATRVSKVDARTMQKAPVRHVVDRATEAFFARPALFTLDAYTHWGVPCQAVKVNSRLDRADHAFLVALVTQKIAQFCHDTFGMSMVEAQAWLATYVVGLKAKQALSSCTSAICGLFGGSKPSAASEPNVQSGWGSYFGFSSSSSGNQLKAKSASPRLQTATTDIITRITSSPHFTAERVEGYTNQNFIAAVAQLFAGFVETLGAFHFLDQAILLNARINFNGFAIQTDELLTGVAASQVIHPIVSFIKTGTAAALGGGALASPMVVDHDAISTMDHILLLRSLKSKETAHLFEFEAWLNSFDSIAHAAKQGSLDGFMVQTPIGRLSMPKPEKDDTRQVPRKTKIRVDEDISHNIDRH